MHGYDPSTTILEVSPRPGEYALREEDIIDIIEKEGDSIALVLFSGVQYYTGQLFPMEIITQKAHEKVSKLRQKKISSFHNVHLEERGVFNPLAYTFSFYFTLFHESP